MKETDEQSNVEQNQEGQLEVEPVDSPSDELGPWKEYESYSEALSDIDYDEYENDSIDSRESEKTEVSGAQNDTAGMKVEDWSRFDGSTYHKMVQAEAIERLDDPENSLSCEAEVKVDRLEDGKLYKDSRIDLVISQTEDDEAIFNCVDIKSDQMSDWSIAKASEMGDSYGKKQASYVEAMSHEGESKGYLSMCGSNPASDEIKDAFLKSAEQHNIGVLFHDDASPQAIVDDYQKHFRE